MERVVLAKVGDMELTKEDMIRIMRNLPQQQQQQVAGPDGRKRLLDEMVAGELLYLQGVEDGLDQDPKYLELVEEARRTILQQFTVQKLLEAITVDEQEVKDHYDNNQDQFKSGETATASHILMSDEDEIKDVKAQIDSGLDFAEAATKYSTCPSKERGGDLGAFEKGRMVPEFEEVAFAQEIGVVSEPVKTQFGYHLILVNDRSESSVKSFEEVAPQINQQLAMQKQSETYMAEIARLKEKHPVEIFEDALN